MEENFWDESSVPLPNSIMSPTISSSTFEKKSEENSDKAIENPSSQLPNIDVSSTGGETLQTNQRNRNTELLVYTRKRPHQRSQSPPMIPELDQSSTLGTDTQDSTGTSTPKTNQIPVSTVPSDLEIPIALRKGRRTCTNHPIAKYLSYEKLSPQHRAFT